MKKERIYQVCFFVAFFVIWEGSVKLFGVADYLFPGPVEVISSFFQNFLLLATHAKITIWEAGAGFLIGFSVASVLAVATIYFRFLEITVYPMIVALQTIPKVAIAPLLLIWLGFGVSSKIATSALMCFFPIIISFTKGLKSTEPDLLDALRACRASKRETLFFARIPGALPDFFAGLKIAIPFSVIGAIVGEFVGSQRGLGHLIMQAQAVMDISLVFALLLCLGLIGVFAYCLVSAIEKRLISWHVSKDQENQENIITW